MGMGYYELSGMGYYEEWDIMGMGYYEERDIMRNGINPIPIEDLYLNTV